MDPSELSIIDVGIKLTCRCGSGRARFEVSSSFSKSLYLFSDSSSSARYRRARSSAAVVFARSTFNTVLLQPIKNLYSSSYPISLTYFQNSIEFSFLLFNSCFDILSDSIFFLLKIISHSGQFLFLF